jgi:hypothetical protein
MTLGYKGRDRRRHPPDPGGAPYTETTRRNPCREWLDRGEDRRHYQVEEVASDGVFYSEHCGVVELDVRMYWGVLAGIVNWMIGL